MTPFDPNSLAPGQEPQHSWGGIVVFVIALALAFLGYGVYQHYFSSNTHDQNSPPEQSESDAKKAAEKNTPPSPSTTGSTAAVHKDPNPSFMTQLSDWTAGLEKNIVGHMKSMMGQTDDRKLLAFTQAYQKTRMLQQERLEKPLPLNDYQKKRTADILNVMEISKNPDYVHLFPSPHTKSSSFDRHPLVQFAKTHGLSMGWTSDADYQLVMGWPNDPMKIYMRADTGKASSFSILEIRNISSSICEAITRSVYPKVRFQAREKKPSRHGYSERDITCQEIPLDVSFNEGGQNVQYTLILNVSNDYFFNDYPQLWFGVQTLLGKNYDAFFKKMPPNLSTPAYFNDAGNVLFLSKRPENYELLDNNDFLAGVRFVVMDDRVIVGGVSKARCETIFSQTPPNLSVQLLKSPTHQCQNINMMEFYQS